MYNFNGTIIEQKKAKVILENFQQHFLNDTYPERILFINHLNHIDATLPIEQLGNINIPKKYNIFFYHERLKILYLTSFEEICIYVEQLEPWEDIDCLVFDDELNWFIGITHNDTILLNGIKC